MTLLERRLAKLKGQTAWITGGKRVGRTVAHALAEQGVNLVLSYRHSVAEAVETVSMAEKCGVQAFAVRVDVSDRANVAVAVDRVRAVFPKIDILVNMASVYEPVAIEKAGQREWEDNIGAHILGTFWPSQLIVPMMPRGGHIINIADITSVSKPQKRNVPYIATKAAVAGMTKAMALDYGERGIFVNAIAPGPILPPDDFPRERWERIRERSAVKYGVTDDEAVEQFALLVLYLSLTTMSSGHIYPLDQGQNLS